MLYVVCECLYDWQEPLPSSDKICKDTVNFQKSKMVQHFPRSQTPFQNLPSFHCCHVVLLLSHQAMLQLFY